MPRLRSDLVEDINGVTHILYERSNRGFNGIDYTYFCGKESLGWKDGRPKMGRMATCLTCIRKAS